ncbi:MAG TPA: penicillin-binding transpeptidase domain-containing protein [Terracidiphilus sp.]|nr:penicillin-binding transpeptidase domain-containing protein [Terracidiphilus sp.]
MLRKSFAWVPALVCLIAALPVAAQSGNAALQSAVSRAMAGQRGTALVLEVRSHRVLASYRLDVAARRVAAPGSSIKPFTLMALLEAGKLDGHTTLMCRRSLSIAGRRLDCTHPDVKQPLDPAAALAYSCNSYFTAVALRLTPTQLHDSLLRDGFASATSLASAEAAGEVALAQSPAQQQLQAIGEWGVKVTPLEMARAYRQLALLQTKHDAKLDPLFAGLEQSVTFGMGRAAQPEAAMKVAGKTGTAPADEGPWTHAWFAGYAPAEDPEIVAVVFLEKGRGGSDAASVARAIFTAFAQSRTATAAASTEMPQ